MRLIKKKKKPKPAPRLFIEVTEFGNLQIRVDGPEVWVYSVDLETSRKLAQEVLDKWQANLIKSASD